MKKIQLWFIALLSMLGHAQSQGCGAGQEDDGGGGGCTDCRFGFASAATTNDSQAYQACKRIPPGKYANTYNDASMGIGAHQASLADCGVGYYHPDYAVNWLSEAAAGEVECTLVPAGHEAYIYDGSGTVTMEAFSQTNRDGRVGAQSIFPCPTDKYVSISMRDNHEQCKSPAQGYLVADTEDDLWIDTAADMFVPCGAPTWNSDATSNAGTSEGSTDTTRCAAVWSDCAAGNSVTVAATTISDATCVACTAGKYKEFGDTGVAVGSTTPCTDVLLGYQTTDRATGTPTTTQATAQDYCRNYEYSSAPNYQCTAHIKGKGCSSNVGNFVKPFFTDYCAYSVECPQDYFNDASTTLTCTEMNTVMKVISRDGGYEVVATVNGISGTVVNSGGEDVTLCKDGYYNPDKSGACAGVPIGREGYCDDTTADCSDGTASQGWQSLRTCTAADATYAEGKSATCTRAAAGFEPTTGPLTNDIDNNIASGSVPTYMDSYAEIQSLCAVGTYRYANPTATQVNDNPNHQRCITIPAGTQGMKSSEPLQGGYVHKALIGSADATKELYAGVFNGDDTGSDNVHGCSTGTWSAGDQNECEEAAGGYEPQDSGGAYTSSEATQEGECVAGTNSTGGAQCAACPIGTYANADGQDVCTLVQDGYYPVTGGAYAGSGATGEQACPAGTKSSFQNKEECVACPIRTYANADGQDVCTQVPDGSEPQKITNGVTDYTNTGATNLGACNTGEISTGGAECLAPSTCDPGQYVSVKSNSTHAQTCVDCPIGTYRASSDSGVSVTSCNVVQPGEYPTTAATAPFVNSKATAASDCIAGDGKYSVFEDDGNSNQRIIRACRTCTAGTEYVTNAQECTKCAKGSYRATTFTATTGCEVLDGFSHFPADDLGDYTNGTVRLAVSKEPCVDYSAMSLGNWPAGGSCKTCVGSAAAECRDGTCGTGDGKKDVSATANTAQFICEDCAVPYFNILTTDAACAEISCPKGKGQRTDGNYNSAEDSDYNCQPCEARYYSDADDSGVCTLATAGFYPSKSDSDDEYVASGAQDRVACPAGSWNTNGAGVVTGQGVSRCFDQWNSGLVCPKGSYIETAGTAISDAKCTPCPRGTFHTTSTAVSAMATAFSCTDVSAGYHPVDGAGDHETGTGAVNQEICTGQYTMAETSGPFNGKVIMDCAFCDKGYQFDTTTSECTICPINMFQDSDSTASVTCTAVTAGNLGVDAAGNYVHVGAEAEAACPFGSYNDAKYAGQGSHNAGPATPGALSTSTSLPTTGVVCLQSWSTCPAGKFVQTVASASSNVVCTDCVEGEFKSTTTPIGTLGTNGVTHGTGNGCTEAGPGHRATDGSIYTALGAIAKEKCAVGLFSTDGHLDCPGIVQAGSYQVDATAGGTTYESGTGAVNEHVCHTGLYNIAVNGMVSQACKMCGPGFKFVSKNADCLVCPVDTYNRAAAAPSVCTAVAAGKIAIGATSGLYVLSEATDETDCNPGSFNTDGKGGDPGTLDCANPWVACAEGTYPDTLASTTRAADCQPCPNGSFKSTTTPKLSTSTANDCAKVSVDHEAQAGNSSHVSTGAVGEGACARTKFNDKEVNGFVEGPCEDCVQPVGYANASLCNTCANETAAGCLTGVCGSGFGRLPGLSQFACEACLNPQYNSEISSGSECSDVTCNAGMGQIPDGTTLSDGTVFVFDPNKNRDHNCQVCPKDSFSNTSSAGQCHAVDAGYYAGISSSDDTWVDSGSTFQHPCSPGTYNADGSSVPRDPTDSLKSGCSQKWTTCPVGYHVKSAATTARDRECVICDAGKYNDVPSFAMAADQTTVCKDIPDGHEGHNSTNYYPANGVGATKIVPCPGGSIEPNGDGPCVNIPAGFEGTNGTGLSTDVYAASGASGKRRCESGMYNVMVNGMVSEACKYCAAGYEYTKTTTPCVICEIGEYQPSSTDPSVRCKSIGPGKQAIDSNGDYPLGGVGAVGREDCVPPKFNGNGLGRCGQKPIDPSSGLAVTGSSPQTWSPCGLGYYVSSQASPARDVTCTRCAAGAFRDSITSADPNAIVNVNQTNTCEDVPNGHYGADDADNFVAVVAGTAGAEKAVPCPRNTYNADGNGDCLSPGAGYHASNSTDFFVAEGAVKKVVCPDGTWNGGSTAGQGGTPGTRGCSETWSACIPGTHVSVAASTTQDATCTACASGTYQTATTTVLNVDRQNQCDLISIGFQGQDGPLATDSYVATGASHQVACVAGTWNNDTTASCKNVRPGYVGVDASGQWQPTTAVLEEACGAGLYNIADDNGFISTPCQYCAAGTEFMGQTKACRTCVAGTFQKDSAVANVVCQACSLNSQTVNSTSGDYIELAASGCVTCPTGEISIRWSCDIRICQCDNGPAAVGVECPSHGAYKCADGSCIHPDTFLHVLKGKSVSKVRAGELRSGDLVIGEDSTSSVQRVERFTVSDRGCIVPENLCQEKLNEKIVLSRNHAVRCPEWPRDNWMFCQEDWQREAVKEYVHVELENYMTDHLLSDSVVLESWDGYKRTTDEAPASCETGCPWPHDWEQSKQDPRKHIRVDLRKATNIDLRRMREGREVSDTGLKILKSYLAKK